jgi:hypothetical protein
MRANMIKNRAMKPVEIILMGRRGMKENDGGGQT